MDFIDDVAEVDHDVTTEDENEEEDEDSTEAQIRNEIKLAKLKFCRSKPQAHSSPRAELKFLSMCGAPAQVAWGTSLYPCSNLSSVKHLSYIVRT